jgi:Predicted RNA-binding proteins
MKNEELLIYKDKWERPWLQVLKEAEEASVQSEIAVVVMAEGEFFLGF